MKNIKRVWITILILIILSIFLYFFYTNNYKSIKNGNNISKSVNQIEDYILNISSYKATIELTVNSNKNTNKYLLKQEYSSDGNVFKQEVLQPENIKGLTTSYDGQNLKIENTKLGLNSLYENYKFIAENNLCLKDFLQGYKENNNYECEEKQNEIIMKLQDDKTIKKIYIDKNTGNPTKIEIQDINQKTSAYIEYKEIEINNTKKEDVVAFKVDLINCSI